jgi:hypothetical protein
MSNYYYTTEATPIRNFFIVCQQFKYSASDTYGAFKGEITPYNEKNPKLIRGDSWNGDPIPPPYDVAPYPIQVFNFLTHKQECHIGHYQTITSTTKKYKIHFEFNEDLKVYTVDLIVFGLLHIRYIPTYDLIISYIDDDSKKLYKKYSKIYKNKFSDYRLLHDNINKFEFIHSYSDTTEDDIIRKHRQRYLPAEINRIIFSYLYDHYTVYNEKIYDERPILKMTHAINDNHIF